MRILFINYEYPPIGGGAGNALDHIAQRLAARGVSVTIVTSRYAGLPAHEVQAGVELYRVPAIRRRADRSSPTEMMTFMAGGLLPTLRLARRWRPDVTCAFFGIPGGPLALAVRAAFGVPYVVSLRGGDVPGFQPGELGLTYQITRPLIQLIWRASSGLIANSAGLADLARRTWREAPIELIPNGVDTRRFQPSSRPGRNGPHRLLFVGRLARQKDLGTLIEAVRRCRQPVVLRIVGDGPEREALRVQATQAGVSARVEFAGWASRDDLVSHYAWADTFVFPSLAEGLANALLEALAAGLPVVATHVAGNLPLVEDAQNGYLVTPGQAAELALAIDRLAGDPLTHVRLGRAARSLAMRYDWDAVAQRYLEVLQKAAELPSSMPTRTAE